jgi:hypothetical protein
MRVVEARQHVTENPHLQIDRQFAATYRYLQSDERLPFEVVHCNEVAVPILAHFIGLHDIGVIETRCQPSLIQKHR